MDQPRNRESMEGEGKGGGLVGLPLLPGGVPYLGLDDLVVDSDAPGGELDPNGGLGLEAELVAREPREQVGFADPGVANEHDLEEVVVVVLRPVRHGCSSLSPGRQAGRRFPSLLPSFLNRGSWGRRTGKRGPQRFSGLPREGRARWREQGGRRPGLGGAYKRRGLRWEVGRER
jgi:hypothetical protein